MWVKTKKNKQWIPVFHCYNRSTTVWKRRDRENPTNHKRGDREAGAGAEQDKRAAPRDSRRVSRDAPGTAARTQRSQAAHGGDAPHHTLPQPRIFRRDGWDSRPRKAGAKRERRDVSRKCPPKVTLQDDFCDLEGTEGTLEAVDTTNFFKLKA